MTLRGLQNALLAMAAMLLLLPGLANAAPGEYANPDALYAGANAQELPDPDCETTSASTSDHDTCNTDSLCTPPALVADNPVVVQLQTRSENTPWSVAMNSVHIGPDPRPPCIS